MKNLKLYRLFYGWGSTVSSLPSHQEETVHFLPRCSKEFQNNKQQKSKYNRSMTVIQQAIIGETFLFMHYFPFLCWIKFCSGCFRKVFFHLGVKKCGCWSRQTGGRLMQYRLYWNWLGWTHYGFPLWLLYQLPL